MLSRVAQSALDLLMPMSCAVCGREGRLVCDGCKAALPRLERPYCAICADPDKPLCDFCAREPPAVDGICAPYLMFGPVPQMIYGFKYHNLRASAPELGGLLASYLDSHPVPADVIMPVPLHPRRMRQRGYNQSELLARQLGKRAGLPVDARTLRRKKNTPPQVSMTDRQQRQQNIQGAFECVAGLQGERILLVDDVVTTGSTMSACAAALKDAGASAVWGLALARQG
ncbi:MAG: ComF family protein [Chloroflexi bacterium]|nr:ComF family protein [Chloroflexota bacterium]